MEGVAVDLDDQAVVGPHGVDFVRPDPCVELWLREVRSAYKGQEPLLGLRAGEGPAARSFEDLPKECGARAVGGKARERFDGRQAPASASSSARSTVREGATAARSARVTRGVVVGMPWTRRTSRACRALVL